MDSHGLIEAAIALKIPEMKWLCQRDIKVAERCPECNCYVVCISGNLGMFDFFDVFAHFCLNPECRHFCRAERFQANICGGRRRRKADDICLFCGRQVKLFN